MKHYHIPIFVPHRGCPFDCVFCNQRRIAGDSDPTPAGVRKQIEEYLASFPDSPHYTEAAFFGGSFTGIPMAEQTAFLDAALSFIQDGRIDGIRLSTRPDYITRPILDNLLSHGVTAIELGVQSMCGDVLEASGRGHTPNDVKNAVSLIREYPFSLGLQVMTGLPGSSDEKDLITADRIIGLKPDFVRIYPTLVIEDTALAELYRSEAYQPPGLSSAVKLCKEMKLKFINAGIDVIRISLQTTDEICENGSVIAGPYHPAFGELVDSMILSDRLEALISDYRNCDITAAVNPSDVSRAVGHKKANVKSFYSRYGIRLRIKADPSVLPASHNGVPKLTIN